MSDRDGFLQAIIANPDDDAPRLIYADWLDEHGDGPRAEFIRLQCRLAHIDPDDVAQRALDLRTRELLSEHRLRWEEELPIWTRRERLRYRRGFVAGVSVYASQFLKGRKGLCSNTPLESLELRNSWGYLAKLAECPSLAGLTELAFSYGPVGVNPEGLEALLRSPHLSRLRALNLDDSSFDSRSAGLLADSPLASRLTEFHLVGVRDGNVSARRLAASPLGKRCEVLRLVRVGLSGPDASSVANFSGLRELDLSLNPLGDDGVTAIVSSLRHDGMTCLALRETHLGRNGIAALASPRLKQLRWLLLDFNDLGDDVVRVLASSNLGCLTRLSLYGTRITDSGGVLLGEMPTLASLRLLDIGLNNVTDATAEALARSPHLDGLRWLGVASTGITPKGQADLRRKFGDRLLFEVPCGIGAMLMSLCRGELSSC